MSENWQEIRLSACVLVNYFIETISYQTKTLIYEFYSTFIIPARSDLFLFTWLDCPEYDRRDDHG